jgi:nucleoside-diphosphate-sugar epimerase
MRLFQSEITQKELVISNPSKFWSYLYEEDFAAAIEGILINLNITSTVNVGNPILTEIREIVAIWHGQSLSDHKTYEPSAANIGFFPDIEKLCSIGWNPSISLEEGIQRTRKAFSERVNAK